LRPSKATAGKRGWFFGGKKDLGYGPIGDGIRRIRFQSCDVCGKPNPPAMGFSFHWFTAPLFVWICAGFLILLAVLTGIRWWLLCREAMLTLRRARDILTETSGQTEFYSSYHDSDGRIRAAFQPVKIFGDAWQRWTATFQIFRRADGKSVISSDKATTEFFSLGSWERTMAMHWYRALPNYLVGLGLCFTFLGVVAVISLAAASLQASKDAADQTEALRQLLAAASTKFWTSLAGVGASVVYSWFFRWRQINVDRSIAAFVTDLNRRVFVLNANALLLQIREEDQRQTSCLESMATNIGVAVGEQFTRASRIMTEAIAALDKTVQGMGAQMGEKTDSMKQAITDLSGGIVETTSKDLEKLVAAAVDALNTTLRDHLDAVAASLKETCREIDSTREAFSDVTDNAVKVRSEFSTLGEEIQTRTAEVSEMLLRTESDVEAKLRGAVGAAEEIQSAIHKAAESAAGMDSLGAGLAKAATSVQEAAELWRLMGEDFAKLTTANGTASETVKDSMESLRLQWEAQGARIGEIDTHLAKTIDAVQQHFDGYALRLREYTTEMDTQLGRAVGSFSATLETLGDAPERFGDAGSQLQLAAQNAVAALEPLHKLSGLADAITKSAEALRAAIPVQPETEP
jgi:ABC-type transporter Mla subunit MlaD